MLGEFAAVTQSGIDLREETINRLPAELVEVVYLINLHNFNLVSFAVEIVDSLDCRKLFPGHIPRPVSGSGDHQHRLGRNQRSNLHIARIDAQSRRVLAQVAALHDGGNHVHRRGKPDAFVHRPPKEKPALRRRMRR